MQWTSSSQAGRPDTAVTFNVAPGDQCVSGESAAYSETAQHVAGQARNDGKMGASSCRVAKRVHGPLQSLQ